MNREEFNQMDEINSRLEKIADLFYENLSNHEAHFQLGKLKEYVQNIYENCKEVDV